MLMYTVYILRSLKTSLFYVGTTENMKLRLQQHNSGQVTSTSSGVPYELVWSANFTDKTRAYNFELYLKSSSGHAFRNKHLV